MVSAVSGFFGELFVPFPEALDTVRKKDLFDHVAEHVQSANGAWDVFHVISCAISNLKVLRAIPQKAGALVDRVSDVISTAGIGLSIPAILSDANTLRRSCIRLRQVHHLTDTDPLKKKKIVQGYKTSFLDAMNFTNSLSQASIFLDQVKIVALEARHLHFLDGIYYGTSLVTDGMELIEECYKLRDYDAPKKLEQDQKLAKLEQKKKLSWMKVAKDISSVAISLFALVGLLFTAIEGPMIAVAWAALCTFWLTLKISCDFYNKIVLEARA